MKTMNLHLLFVCLLLAFQPCAAAPFAARGNTKNEAQEEDDGSADAVNAQAQTIKIRGASGTGRGSVSVEDIELNDPETNSLNKALVHLNEYFHTYPQNDEFNDQDGISQNLQQDVNALSNTPSLVEFLTATRRKFHRHPELMYEEDFTSQTIQSVLTELDISFTTGWAKNTHRDVYPGPGGYGIVADIGTGKPPCIILRADMDALPIEEKTPLIDKSYKSHQKGKMHACGHDGHTTMLLGAAVLLKKMESGLQGTIRLMFQPAEEGGAGAKRMIEEGVVSMEPKAQLAFGMHVWPMLPSGTIASKPGPLLAAADTFEILVSGKGGHAAMPHLAIDPIVAASFVVLNLQPIISRITSPLESGVVSVTQFTSGDAFNVIPAAAVLKGTIRALTTETLVTLRSQLEHIVNTTAAVHNCNVTISYSPDYYPPTANDPTLFEQFSTRVGALVSKEGKVRDIEPTMGGEDFSFLTQEIPSTFLLVGQGGEINQPQHSHFKNNKPATDYSLHHPNFALDEDVMPTGVELHVSLALRGLKRLHHQQLLEDGDDVAKSEL